MKVSRIISTSLLAIGLAFLLAGIYPKLRGGDFNSGFFAPGIAFFLIGGAIRRRRQKEEERGDTKREE